METLKALLYGCTQAAPEQGGGAVGEGGLRDRPRDPPPSVAPRWATPSAPSSHRLAVLKPREKGSVRIPASSARSCVPLWTGLVPVLTQLGQTKLFTKVWIQFQPFPLSPAAELDRIFLQSGSSLRTDLILS